MARKKILLVDDSPTAILYEQMVLGQGPYDLVTANDGEEALEKAVDEQPDLILLDVLMPKVQGFDVLRMLREQETTQSIPVIMVTTLGEMQDLEEGFSGGCNDYITKPIDAQELLARVESWLGDE